MPLVYIVHICGRVYARYPIAPTSNWEQHEEFISRSYANPNPNPNANVIGKSMRDVVRIANLNANIVEK